jgi:hypothetical protein
MTREEAAAQKAQKPQKPQHVQAHPSEALIHQARNLEQEVQPDQDRARTLDLQDPTSAVMKQALAAQKSELHRWMAKRSIGCHSSPDRRRTVRPVHPKSPRLFSAT